MFQKELKRRSNTFLNFMEKKDGERIISAQPHNKNITGREFLIGYFTVIEPIILQRLFRSRCV